jgi:hypothetical protein
MGAVVSGLSPVITEDEWGVVVSFNSQNLTNEQLAEAVANNKIPKNAQILNISSNPYLSDISPLAELTPANGYTG